MLPFDQVVRQIFVEFPISLRSACAAHFIFLCIMTLIFDEVYKILSGSLCMSNRIWLLNIINGRCCVKIRDNNTPFVDNAPVLIQLVTKVTPLDVTSM